MKLTEDKRGESLVKLAKSYAPGTLNLIGGSAQMGKTSFAMNLALSLQKPVAYFSLEMHKKQFVERYSHLRISDNFIIVDEIVTLEEICEMASYLRENQGVQMIIVDTLLHLRLRCENGFSKHWILSVIQGLKSLALTLQIPVIALTKISCQVFGEDAYRPQPKHIPFWNELESWVDDVRLLYRPEYYEVSGSPSVLEVISASGEKDSLRFRYLSDGDPQFVGCDWANDDGRGETFENDDSVEYESEKDSCCLLQNIEQQMDAEYLRSNLARIEEEIFFRDEFSVNEEDKEQIHSLLRTRAAILNQMFELHCTDEELLRFKEVNLNIQQFTEKYKLKFAKMEKWLSPFFYVEITSLFDDTKSVWSMRDSAFYGSRWPEILNLLSTPECYLLEGDEIFGKSGVGKPCKCDEEELAIAQLENLTISPLIKYLCKQQFYSVPDILLLNCFYCEFRWININTETI